MKKSKLVTGSLSTIFAISLMMGLCGCGSTGGQQEKLSSKVRGIMNSPEFKHTSWTIKVVDLKTGEVLQQASPNMMLDPASTTKLFTVATALDVFGPDYRFTTPVYEQGALSPGGQLNGNLILVASGDLAMGGRVTEGGKIEYTDMDHADANALGNATLTKTDPLAGLDDLARQVAASGVKTVNGNVIIDARLFPTGRPEGDQQASILSPIVINDNLLDITVTPTSPGSPAEIAWRPQTSLYTVTSTVTTVDKGGETDLAVSSPSPGSILIEGSIEAGGGDVVQTYEVEDPESFARTLFIEALGRAGVAVEAPALGANPAGDLPPEGDYTSMTQAALLESPPFSEYAKLILKVSLNYGANSLLPLMAVHEGKKTFEDGLQIEHSFLEKAGVSLDGLIINDGEGGAGKDYICAECVVQLLRYMSTSKDFKAFEDALPIMGVDGSLAQLLGDKSPIKGKVRAKTGTHGTGDLLNDRIALTARALGGYMTASSGRELAFDVSANMIIPEGNVDMAALLNKHASILEAIYEEY